MRRACCTAFRILEALRLLRKWKVDTVVSRKRREGRRARCRCRRPVNKPDMAIWEVPPAGEVAHPSGDDAAVRVAWNASTRCVDEARSGIDEHIGYIAVPGGSSARAWRPFRADRGVARCRWRLTSMASKARPGPAGVERRPVRAMARIAGRRCAGARAMSPVATVRLLPSRQQGAGGVLRLRGPPIERVASSSIATALP